MIVNPARGQLNRDFFSLCPFALENSVSRAGLAVPSRVSLPILHAQAESGT